MNKRNHKHRDLIEQWLADDSLEVEVFSNHKWTKLDNPTWLESYDYQLVDRQVSKMFLVGDLVKCNESKLVIMVTSSSTKTFTGTVLVSDNKWYTVGEHDDSWDNECFTKIDKLVIGE